MAGAGKPTDSRNHPVRWDGEDWDRIERTAELMSREQHLDLGPTDVIRAATRRFCEEKLGTEAAR